MMEKLFFHRGMWIGAELDVPFLGEGFINYGDGGGIFHYFWGVSIRGNLCNFALGKEMILLV